MSRSPFDPRTLVFLMCPLACGGDEPPPVDGTATSSSTSAGPGGSSGGGPGGSSGGGPSGGSTAAADETSGGADAESSDGGTTSAGVEDLDMRPEDFVCMLDWPKVRRFRITNLLGNAAETMAVAESPDGGVYPPGTVIQLVPNEAMVKRAVGWAPETNDWEYFSLSTSADGTEILERGTTEVRNQFGGNCFGCHSAAEPQWDSVCEQDHGCDPIPVDEATIQMLQDNDPRCGG